MVQSLDLVVVDWFASSDGGSGMPFSDVGVTCCGASCSRLCGQNLDLIVAAFLS